MNEKNKIDLKECPFFMHEHINFFTPLSLVILLTKNGFQVVDISEFGKDTNSGWSHIAVLSRKRN
jgi:hypothetical protein